MLSFIGTFCKTKSGPACLFGVIYTKKNIPKFQGENFVSSIFLTSVYLLSFHLELVSILYFFIENESNKSTYTTIKIVNSLEELVKNNKTN